MIDEHTLPDDPQEEQHDNSLTYEDVMTEGKRELLTLSFENLTVYVPGDQRSCCGCWSNPLKNYLHEYFGMSLEEREPFYALNAVSGCVSSGELCLVLGPNEISKSTLLRALSGRLNDQDELHGILSVNGIPLSTKSQQGWRKLTPYVSASDASHSPVLTVRETLAFAAQCTSHDVEASNERVDKLLKLLGLDHVADTVVGDDNLRGISGGQKRRVTVGEMMTDPSNSAVFCFENITDGLASTDSYSLLQTLKLGCENLSIAGVVTLLQPSDDIMELFDKVLVLGSNGELTYFGPADRPSLERFFSSPSDVEESAGSLCDLVLRQFLADSSGKIKEHDIRKMFHESQLYKDLMSDLATIRSTRKYNELSALLPKKKYSTSGWHQFRLLCGRRQKLIARNAVTYTRIGIAILFGIIIGSLFGDLDQDLMGSLSRTGYIFLNSFLVLMLSSAVVLPEGFRQRPTLFKHRSAEFFSGRIAYLAQVLMDIPLSIFEAILLGSISYFWVEMRTGAGTFFYFLGCLIGLEFVGQAFGRLLCALFRKQVLANAMSTVIIIAWGSLSGFMPSYKGIPWILKWITWLTPVAYSFEGMMVNEFANRELGGFVVGDTESIQIGTIGGNTWLTFFDLPRETWRNTDLDIIKGFNIFMLFIIAIIFDMLGLYFVEVTRSWYHNQTRRPQSRAKSLIMTPSYPTEKNASLDKVPTENVRGNEDRESTRETQEWPSSLAVRNLYYRVPVKQQLRFSLHSLLGPCLVRLSGGQTTNEVADQKEITLLESVDARFSRGRMCALMGSSGAGKTTLLDVIAGYKTGGQIIGDVMIDGQPKNDKMWQRISGYAEQNDILNPYLSTLETLRFTASCRLHKTANINEIIDKVVELMDLKEWLDVVVGREREGEGLPKHARKRLTIAVQLVVQPRILFLDEPTTGLGNNAASLVLTSIRRATDALGLITLATIHQPSKLIWDSFDDLLLLAKGGRVSYMGEMGLRSSTVLRHFRKLAKDDPGPSCNPADYILSALTSVEPEVAVSAFKGSDLEKLLHGDIEADMAKDKSGSKQRDHIRTNSHIAEIILLFRRQLITQWRNPSYCFMRLLSSVLVSLYMSVLFFGDKSTIGGAVSSIGAIFFLVFVLVIPMAASVVPLIEDRAVLYRETVSGTYSRISYGIGSMIADIPFHMLNTILMFLFFYFIVGFRLEGPIVGYFILQLLLANWVITSMGQLFALVSPNEESAHGLAGLSVILSVILMGFLITASAMPSGWTWAYWGNLFHYILQGLVSNEVAGRSYHLELDLNWTDLIPSPGSLSNVTNLVLFEPAIDGQSSNEVEAGSLLSIIATAGNGTNPFSAIQDIRSLVECFATNACMSNPPISTMLCLTGFRPPCRVAFDTAVASFPLGDIAQCFGPNFGANVTGNETGISESSINGTPSDFSIVAYEQQNEMQQWETLLCLVRAFLPPDLQSIIGNLIEIIRKSWGVLLILINVIENGINIPGETILFFFGWAEFQNGSFNAEFKWHYCMTAVAVFLVSIEMFKLFAVRCIVWTRR